MRTHAFRLKPGQDLKRELAAFVNSHELRAACVLTCVGSLQKATLRLATAEVISEFPGPFEIVSLVGTASAGGGLHLHISLADQTGKTVGGHLVEGNPIYTTAEIVLAELGDVQFDRVPDPETGYDELKVTKLR